MAKEKPNTYRISRILRRFLGFGFADSFQEGDVSSEALRQAKEYSSDHGPISLLHPNGEAGDNDEEPNEFIHYQKELQAKRHLNSPHQPKTPGKILRLPPQRYFESDSEE
jgi:hypothetical protein